MNESTPDELLPPSSTPKQRWVALFGSSRPMSWVFGPVLYIAGAIHSGAPLSSFDVLAIGFAQTITLSFPLSIVVFGVNDVYDYASDVVNPRKHGTSIEGIVLAPIYHDFVICAAVASSATIIVTSFLQYWSASTIAGGWQIYLPSISTASLVALAWMYSAPPFRLKERPFVDSASNALIVWLVWFIGFTSSSSMTGLTRGIRDSPLEVNMLALAATGVHALGAAADIEADRSAGSRTIGTALGRRGCAIYGTVVYALGFSTEMCCSVIGVYFAGGLCTMALICAYPSSAWVHRGLQIIILGTVVMSALWVVVGLNGSGNR